MKQAAVALLLLLLVTAPVAADAQVQYFPLVFNEAAHPPQGIYVPRPTPQPTPTPAPILVIVGCSQVPGYDGPVEYPTRVEEGYVYQACFPAQQCSLGRVGQEGRWTYKLDADTYTSLVVLAGIQTIVMPQLRLDNRYQNYQLVATQEQCAYGQCIVMVAEFLYPFAPVLHSGTYIATLPQALTRERANGVGVWSPATGLVTHTTFWGPCDSQGERQPDRWSGQELLQMHDDGGGIRDVIN